MGSPTSSKHSDKSLGRACREHLKALNDSSSSCNHKSRSSQASACHKCVNRIKKRTKRLLRGGNTSGKICPQITGSTGEQWDALTFHQCGSSNGSQLPPNMSLGAKRVSSRLTFMDPLAEVVPLDRGVQI